MRNTCMQLLACFILFPSTPRRSDKHLLEKKPSCAMKTQRREIYGNDHLLMIFFYSLSLSLSFKIFLILLMRQPCISDAVNGARQHFHQTTQLVKRMRGVRNNETRRDVN